MSYFFTIEWNSWLQMWNLAGKTQITYKRNGIEDISIRAVKCSPSPEGFGFGEFQLYDNSVIFEMEKGQLSEIFPPKEGDIIVYDNIEYPVSKTSGSPAWLDVGSNNITIKVQTRNLR
jgi:hypothetical protein